MIVHDRESRRVFQNMVFEEEIVIMDAHKVTLQGCVAEKGIMLYECDNMDLEISSHVGPVSFSKCENLRIKAQPMLLGGIKSSGVSLHGYLVSARPDSFERLDGLLTCKCHVQTLEWALAASIAVTLGSTRVGKDYSISLAALLAYQAMGIPAPLDNNISTWWAKIKKERNP